MKSKRRHIDEEGLFQLLSWGRYYQGPGVLSIRKCTPEQMDELSEYWFANRDFLMKDYEERWGENQMPFGFFLFEQNEILAEALSDYRLQEDKRERMRTDEEKAAFFAECLCAQQKMAEEKSRKKSDTPCQNPEAKQEKINEKFI